MDITYRTTTTFVEHRHITNITTTKTRTPEISYRHANSLRPCYVLKRKKNRTHTKRIDDATKRRNYSLTIAARQYGFGRNVKLSYGKLHVLS